MIPLPVLAASAAALVGARVLARMGRKPRPVARYEPSVQVLARQANERRLTSVG